MMAKYFLGRNNLFFRSTAQEQRWPKIILSNGGIMNHTSYHFGVVEKIGRERLLKIT